jgi:hypothetical protein
MQPQPPIGKKGSIINNQNKFSQTRKFPKANGQTAPPQYQFAQGPQVQNRSPHVIMQDRGVGGFNTDTQSIPSPQHPPQYQYQYTHQPPPQQPQQPQPQQPQYQGPEPEYERIPGQEEQDYNYTQPPGYTEPQPAFPYDIEEANFQRDLTPEEIEQSLIEGDPSVYQGDHNPNEDEREFVGGKKLYDRQLMQQPMYDEPTMQILNDIASDESFPILVQYITQLSHLGRQAQARLIARASAFQSKNQVFSNIQNQNDYMMAQDDFTYAQIMSKCDYSSYDTNADYFTAEAIMEAQFNIRLRRSRNALNLLQINTQRQESIMSQHPAQEEERKLRSKIPFLGQYMG